jgi:L-ribulose-5-phosphate 4-epimerase
MLHALREQVLEANLDLVRQGLVVDTFGNASGISREEGLVVIKPSGVPYDRLKPSDMVVSDLQGNIVEGSLRPSSDLPTHLVLYHSFLDIGGVAHTHSRHATAWAQARREIPCFGTTHADYFRGPVPVTEVMTDEEIANKYEHNTGEVIVRRFSLLSPKEIPGVLVANHAPFCWGKSPQAAARHAMLLEEIARLAWMTVSINPTAEPISETLRDSHFLRKHGPAARYGQPK